MSKSQYHLEYAAWALKSEQSKSLLSSDRSVPQYGAVAPSCDSSLLEGKKKTIGFWSAVFIIFNRIIGTGYVYMLPMTLMLEADEVSAKGSSPRQRRCFPSAGALGCRCLCHFLLSDNSYLYLCRTLWLVGSLLAAAGMQIYIVWGCVRVDHDSASHTPINLFKGISQKRGREKLSRISISQASILYHMPLCS